MLVESLALSISKLQGRSLPLQDENPLHLDADHRDLQNFLVDEFRQAVIVSEWIRMPLELLHLEDPAGGAEEKNFKFFLGNWCFLRYSLSCSTSMELSSKSGRLSAAEPGEENFCCLYL